MIFRRRAWRPPRQRRGRGCACATASTPTGSQNSPVTTYNNRAEADPALLPVAIQRCSPGPAQLIGWRITADAR